jgi:hypothetical protein
VTTRRTVTAVDVVGLVVLAAAAAWFVLRLGYEELRLRRRLLRASQSERRQALAP